ncbi:MAG: hypothetical protein COX70_04295 [Flavobacteriales bacterium CG_4_10_14_0_2_um_filter_32_8]|nr:MAG: hypothetical protein COX70_04295 [Flavobacteriales bacterium CG_4_10_14_0_2_um_filter_32_8]PJB14878.1 MAG: hypothetical protein CO118_06270 [Flavobacteriales bacterium CG_4_9_14_3_um_filter_32_8]
MKIVRKFLLLFLIISLKTTLLFSQNNTDFFVDTTQHLTVSFGADYSYGSSVMNGKFLNKFLFGGRIEREDKDAAYKSLSSNNRLGGDLNYQFNVEIPLDTLFRKPTISLVVGAENTEHIDAVFTSDLFKFTFDGNKQFAGEFAEIGGTNYNHYQYQKINVGFVNYKYFDDKLAKEGVILSLIKGEQHEAITIPRGSIFTQELGKEIDIDLNYSYNSSDTANKGIKAFNGYGISTNLFTEIFLRNGDKMYLGVEDLGFIYWNKNSLDIASDSTFHYDGIWIDNIFDLNDSLLNNISKDSILNKITTTNQKNSYSIALPTAVNITYTKVINGKWKMNVGVYHKILANYLPFIATNFYYYFNKKIVAKAHLSYGGYGRLNTGLAFAKSFNKYIEVFIGTNNLEAFVAPNLAFNNSGFIGIKSYF